MKHMIHTNEEYIYFITSTIVEWIPLFISHRYCDIIIEGLRYCRHHKGLRLHAYVIMPNHIHLIASTEPIIRLAAIIRDFKRYTSRAITRQLQDDGRRYLLRLLHDQSRTSRDNGDFKVWRNGYYPIGIRSDWFFRQKLDYIHLNPVRKGFVRRPEDWQYSSARDYIIGPSGILELDMLATTWPQNGSE